MRIRDINGWDHIEFQCLPAELHNRRRKSPPQCGPKSNPSVDGSGRCFVAYADCGTGGLLDKALDEYGIERIPGAHCYEFYAGSEAFHELAEEEPGSFYLTDFLVRHFERLVIKGLAWTDSRN